VGLRLPTGMRKYLGGRYGKFLVYTLGGSGMSGNRRRSANNAPLTLAAAIVVHNDCVLIVRRSKKEKFMPKEWGVPCGKVDMRHGERARDAVIRELREETGLSGEITKPVGTLEFPSIWHGRPTRNVQYNYLVALTVGESTKSARWFNRIWARRFSRMPYVKTPKRDQDSRWVPLDKIDQVQLDEHNRKAIGLGLDAYASAPLESSDAMVSSLRR
jgi:8-oxo-dGTP diphosphatase